MTRPLPRKTPDEALQELISDTAGLEIIPIDEKFPPGKETSKSGIYKVLAELQPGGKGFELNRSVKSMQGYANRFRLSIDVSLRFRVRPSAKKGWSKIWRLR